MRLGLKCDAVMLGAINVRLGIELGTQYCFVKNFTIFTSAKASVISK